MSTSYSEARIQQLEEDELSEGSTPKEQHNRERLELV